MAAVHDLLDRLLEDTNLPDDVDAPGYVQRFLASKRPPFIVYEELLGYVLNSDMYVNGRVERHDSHYVHQRTTTFELETVDIPEENYEKIEKLANEAEALIQAECYRINCKIYKALEAAYDWDNADEQVADTINANAYTFDENGDRDDGAGLLYALLDDAAKARARDWYRSGNIDDFWAEYVIDEWTKELEDMGFDTVKIGYSGFSSQGDGASFTAKRFDLKQWTAWWSGPLPTEKGHPYTDDLPVAESLDTPEDFDLKGFVNRPLARLAITSGFRATDHRGVRRFIKDLPDGTALWLTNLGPSSRTPAYGDDWELTQVYADRPQQLRAHANEEGMERMLPSLLKIHTYVAP